MQLLCLSRLCGSRSEANGGAWVPGLSAGCKRGFECVSGIFSSNWDKETVFALHQDLQCRASSKHTGIQMLSG